MMVNGKPLKALVDTGATYSTVIEGGVTDDMLSDKRIEVMGFSGEAETWPITKPLPVRVAGQSLSHNFLYSTRAPVPLLGRDLLIKLGASILCSPDGIIISFPNGMIHNCSKEGGLTAGQNGQWLLTPAKQEEGADIYWVELDEGVKPDSLIAAYNLRKPWI